MGYDLQADKEAWQSAAIQYGPKDAPWSQAESEDYSKANQNLAMALYNKEGGKNLPSYMNANKQVTDRMNENLWQVKKDYARKQFEAQYWSADDTTIDKWMKWNQATLEKDMYGMLTRQAVDSGVEFDKGNTYQKYLADSIKKETPIDNSSYWDKTVNVGKNIVYGMTDTARGIYYATKDEFTWENDYKDYLGDRAASISQWDDSFWKKMGSTFGEQWGWVDVAFAVWSGLSWWALAAPLASMKVAMGFGKWVGKMALKWAWKELFEESLKWAFTNTSKELMEWLMKGNIDDLAALAAKEWWMDSSAYLAKLGRTLNATNKEHKIFTAGSKAEKDFYKNTEAFTNLMGQKLNKTTGLGALDFVSDMFGLPTQMVKFGDGKWLRMSVGWSLMTVWIPSTALLPGAGDMFEKVLLQTGTWTTGKISEYTKSWLYERERSAFEAKYGVNPDEASPELKSQWDQLIQYKLRYSTPSENLTGVAVKDRSGFGQFLYGAADTAANFVGVYAGIRGATKWYNIAKENLAPYSYNKNWELVSNIDFLQKLDAIHNDTRLDDNQRQTAIDELKTQIQSGDTSLQKTIRSVKELKYANAHMMDYMEKIGWNEFGKQIDSQYSQEQYEWARMILEWKTEEGIQKMAEAQGRLDETLAKYTSGEAVKKLQDKMNLLDAYLEKVRNSTAISSAYQRSFVANSFLSHEMDPTMASVRGNDSLVAQVFSTFSQIQNAHQVIWDVLKSEWRYIQDIQNISGDFTALKNRASKVLETSGIPVTKEAVDRLTMLVATPLAQVRLTVKWFGDKNLSKIFDEVFTEHGIDFAQKKEWDKSLAEILSDIGNPDQKYQDSLKLGFSDQLIEQMDTRIQAEQIKIAKYSDFVKANAFRMSQLMEFFGDLTSNVHVQRNIERIVSMDLTKSENITKEELIDTLDHEIKQRSEDGLAIDDLVSQRESAKKLPEDATILAEKDNGVEFNPKTAAATEIMSGDTVAQKLEEESQATLKSHEEDFRIREENLNRFAMFYIHGRAATESYYKNLSYDQNTETVKEVDALESKESDNSYDNDMRIRNFDDDTKKNIQSIYDEFGKDTDNFTMSWLKDLSDRESAEYRKEYYSARKELIANKDLTAGERKALSDKMQEMSKKAVNYFTRDKIIDLAKRSETVEEFETNLQASLVEHFWFNEKWVEKFMDKQFPKSENGLRYNSLIPFWELKRKQDKIRAVNIVISDKWTIIHDSSNPAETYDGNKNFVDKFGNSTLYRIKWIWTSELEKTMDILHVQDVEVNGSLMNDVWRSNGGDRMEKFNEYSKKMEEALSTHDGWGWIYLGDFSEMGNKKIFVRAKEWQATWSEAMSKLTGIDIKNQIESQPNFDARNQMIGNLAKYAKLIWWGEITPNQGSWDNAIKSNDSNEISLTGIEQLDEYMKTNPRSNKVRTLFFDDTSKELDTKLFDWRDFIAPHLAAVLNRSAGNHPTNSLFKTATTMWGGQFIKSKSESFDDAGAILTDPYIMWGIMKAAETDPVLGAVMDLMQKNYGDWAWNPEARSMFMQLNDKYKMVDRIVPMSAYKNIFTRKTGWLWIQWEYEQYRSGDIAEHDLSSMGLKAIDESNKIRWQEKVKVSTQLNRSIVPMEWFTQKEANAINDVFTEIKKDDFLRVSELMKSLWTDPIWTINVIEKEFGVSFKDYRNRDFLTEQWKKNIEKMLTNIMKRNITTGANLEGNYIDLTYIPQYENIRDYINESIKDGQEDNWVILSKDYYKHLYNRNVDRFMMFRYPVVGPKIITAPKIIWKEDLETAFGKLDIGDSIVPNHKLIEQIEWDGDGDKVMLLTDKRLEKVQNLIEKFTDIKKPAYNVDNSKANNHAYTDDLQSLWHQTNFDTFEGKANIGTIDNQLSRVEQLISMGLIDDTPTIKDNRLDPYSTWEKYYVMNDDGTKNYKVSNADYLRGVLGKTLQRAVDNKIIDIKAIKELINDNLKWKKIELSTLQEWDFRKYFMNVTPKEFKSMGFVQFDFGDKYNLRLWDIRYFNEIPGWKDFVIKLNTKAFKMSQDNPFDGKKQDLIVKLSDSEQAEFRKFTLNTVFWDIGRVNDVFGKTFFFDAETKENMRAAWMSDFDIDDAEKKSLRELKKEYDKAYPLYQEMIEKYWEDKVRSYGMMRTFGDAKGYFDRDIYDYSNELGATVQEALNKTKTLLAEKPSLDPKLELTGGIGTDIKTLTDAYTTLSNLNINKYKNTYETLSDIIKTTLSETDQHIFEKMWEVYGKWEQKQFDDYKKLLLAAVENVVFRAIDAHGIKDADSTLLYYIKNADSPLFNLLTSEGTKKINESMVENLNKVTMDRIWHSVDLTEFHNAETYEEKMKAYDKAFQEKAKEMNISDTELQALNKNTRVVYKEYARRWWDIQRVLQHHDTINSYTPENAKIVNSHITSLSREEIKMVGEILWNPKELDMMKTENEARIETTWNVVKESYTNVKDNSTPNNC